MMGERREKGRRTNAKDYQKPRAQKKQGGKEVELDRIKKKTNKKEEKDIAYNLLRSGKR